MWKYNCTVPIFYRSYCMAQKCGTWRWGPASATRRVRPVVPPTYSTSPFHCPRHQPGSPPVIYSTSCYPDGHAQASEVLRPRHSFRPRWGSYTCPQCWYQWPAEGVETPSSNMATHHRERPQTSEPGTVVGPAQSLLPWTVVWYRGNDDTPAGACYMMMLMITQIITHKWEKISNHIHTVLCYSVARQQCIESYIYLLNMLYVCRMFICTACYTSTSRHFVVRTFYYSNARFRHLHSMQ